MRLYGFRFGELRGQWMYFADTPGSGEMRSETDPFGIEDRRRAREENLPLSTCGMNDGTALPHRHPKLQEVNMIDPCT